MRSVPAALLAALFLLLAVGSIVLAHRGASPWLLWPATLLGWLMALGTVQRLGAGRPGGWTDIAVPALFGLTTLWLWEVLVTGLGVPPVLLPAPSAIGGALAANLPTLGEDFVQTFVKAVLVGYAIGCGAGLLAALLCDRCAFLRAGLLPLSSFMSALPLVGVAPIFIMWFGFDWPSKAAVVAVMTFFPMLVNMTAGLAASDRLERDLMATYAASWWQTLWKLRLQRALPFLFNALKINASLALIGAIVAEFFGTPTVGMGFRISIEAGRLNLPMVWAEIAMAALAGSLSYALLSLLERLTTFWHPSQRRGAPP